MPPARGLKSISRESLAILAIACRVREFFLLTMRDTIDHNEDPMTPRSSAVPTSKAVAGRAKTRDSELRELLAHLGRLLAQEYVALLAENPRSESARDEEPR